VISLCKALAYDGLENVLSILAINAGAHVSPTFAGDTLRCATRVVEKHDLGRSPAGALRLRMVGAKNVASAADIVFPDSSTRPDGQVVLDLDFTVAIPKRSAR
jgi:2-methylfumaryl-CoA hydratase